MDRQVFTEMDSPHQDQEGSYNQKNGGLVMQANTGVLEAKVPHMAVDWEDVREQARELFTRDGIIDALLLTANAAVFGTISYAMYKAITIHTYTGLGVTVAGYF